MTGGREDGRTGGREDGELPAMTSMRVTLTRRQTCPPVHPSSCPPAAPRADARRRAPLADHVTDPTPADVGDEWQRPITAFAVALVAITRLVRVVHEERAAAHVLVRHDAPVPAVL